MDIFAVALDHVLQLEGGVSDHMDDPGGLTKWGVTQGVYSAWRTERRLPEQSVREMGEAECHALYRVRYWDVQRLDLLAEISGAVALEVFESGVNCGPSMGGKFLQRAVNFLVPERSRTLLEDGVIGPKTRLEVRLLVAGGYESALVLAQNGEQYGHYRGLVDRSDRYRSFSRGWMKRVLPLLGGIEVVP
jgi:lysozyme family protein